MDNKTDTTLDLKEEVKVVTPGTTYKIPVYRIVEGKGIERTVAYQTIQFVRGSKDGDEPIKKAEGTLHEHLLSMMIADLKYKNTLVPSREGSLVITKLQEALGWLRQRQVDRHQRDVSGTYKE